MRSNSASVTKPSCNAASLSVRSLSMAWWAILRGLVVADDGRQRRHQHQRAFDVFGDLLQIGLALDQELAEVHAAVAHEDDGVDDVEDHQRLVDVHLEIAAGA